MKKINVPKVFTKGIFKDKISLGGLYDHLFFRY